MATLTLACISPCCELTGMNIGVTIAARPVFNILIHGFFPDVRLMAFLAAHCEMFSREREGRFGMVKSAGRYVLPSSRHVTFLAFWTEFVIVRIRMACRTLIEFHFCELHIIGINSSVRFFHGIQD